MEERKFNRNTMISLEKGQPEWLHDHHINVSSFVRGCIEKYQKEVENRE